MLKFLIFFFFMKKNYKCTSGRNWILPDTELDPTLKICESRSKGKKKGSGSETHVVNGVVCPLIMLNTTTTWKKDMPLNCNVPGLVFQI